MSGLWPNCSTSGGGKLRTLLHGECNYLTSLTQLLLKQRLLPGPQDEQNKVVKWVALLLSNGAGLTLSSWYLSLGSWCNVLLAYDTDTGQRHQYVTTTKIKAEYARFMNWVVATHCPETPLIRAVQDNYSTHTYGAFYEHLPVETARQLRHQLEHYYTPQYGSWLK